MPDPSFLSALRALPGAARPDLRRLAFLSAGYLLTLAVPRRMDRRVVARLIRSPAVVAEPWVEKIRESMQEILGSTLPGADFRALAREYCEMVRETQWIRLRALHTKEVPVETSVDGLHRLRDALKAGKGAILWGMTFCATLPKLIALQRAGIPLVLLSDAYHGVPSTSRLGLEVVGPLFSTPENRYLAERLIIPADLSLGYLRRLQERLAGNACVCIRGDLESRRANVLAPVFGREKKFAPGAPGLSWKLGTPLLPLHVVRDAPFRYRAVIHPAIQADRSSDRAGYIRCAVDQFAGILQRCAAESPANWEIWALTA